MTDKNTETTPEMTSWSMCTSILVGTRQAIAKAAQEHEALLAANAGNPRPAGASTIADTLATLRELHNSMSYEFHRIARSANLPMPEHKQ